MLDTGVLSPNCVFVTRCIIIIIQVDAELLQLKAGSALIKLHAHFISAVSRVLHKSTTKPHYSNKFRVSFFPLTFHTHILSGLIRS